MYLVSEAVSSLSELSQFGSQKRGAISVIFCGSSAMLENLIFLFDARRVYVVKTRRFSKFKWNTV
jgi:hypothetical protein